MATDTDKGSSRIRIQRRFRKEAGGELEPRVMPGVKIVELHFASLDAVLSLDMAELNQDVLDQAAAFGLSTAIGNAAGALKSDSEAFEACENRMRTLLDGQWASDNRLGHTIKDLVEAWARMKLADGGSVDEDWRVARAEDIRTGKYTPDRLQGNAKFAAHYQAVKFEQAQAKLKAAQSKAAEVETDDDLASV